MHNFYIIWIFCEFFEKPLCERKKLFPFSWEDVDFSGQDGSTGIRFLGQNINKENKLNWKLLKQKKAAEHKGKESDKKQAHS